MVAVTEEKAVLYCCIVCSVDTDGRIKVAFVIALLDAGSDSEEVCRRVPPAVAGTTSGQLPGRSLTIGRYESDVRA